MKSKFVLPIICSVIGVSAHAVTPTVVQTAMLGGTTYKLLSNALWDEAEAAAISLGGHLATVETLAENTFLFNTFSPTASSLSTTLNVSLWIGLNDAANEGTFVWSSGSTSAFRNWYPGEPAGNLPDEDYIAILVSGFGAPGFWHDSVGDYRFNESRFGIVEIPPVPEPAAGWLLAVGLLTIGWLTRQEK